MRDKTERKNITARGSGFLVCQCLFEKANDQIGQRMRWQRVILKDFNEP